MNEPEPGLIIIVLSLSSHKLFFIAPIKPESVVLNVHIIYVEVERPHGIRVKHLEIGCRHGFQQRGDIGIKVVPAHPVKVDVNGLRIRVSYRLAAENILTVQLNPENGGISLRRVEGILPNS